MATIIDTNVFIDVERRGYPLDTAMSELNDEGIGISAVTAAELLAGVYRAESPSRRSRREAFVQAILESVPTIPFDLGVARIYAQVLAQLTNSGQIIGTFDLMIAATALANDYDVLTSNVREYERVPGLTVRQPSW